MTFNIKWHKHIINAAREYWPQDVETYRRLNRLSENEQLRFWLPKDIKEAQKACQFHWHYLYRSWNKQTTFNDSLVIRIILMIQEATSDLICCRQWTSKDFNNHITNKVKRRYKQFISYKGFRIQNFIHAKNKRLSELNELLFLPRLIKEDPRKRPFYFTFVNTSVYNLSKGFIYTLTENLDPKNIKLQHDYPSFFFERINELETE